MYNCFTFFKNKYREKRSKLYHLVLSKLAQKNVKRLRSDTVKARLMQEPLVT